MKNIALYVLFMMVPAVIGTLPVFQRWDVAQYSIGWAGGAAFVFLLSYLDGEYRHDA
jgi:hypothetical protein